MTTANVLELLLLLHFVFVGFAWIDIHARYQRRVGSKLPPIWRAGANLPPYTNYFMPGILLVLSVPALGELMWWLLRKEIDQLS